MFYHRTSNLKWWHLYIYIYVLLVDVIRDNLHRLTKHKIIKLKLSSSHISYKIPIT